MPDTAVHIQLKLKLLGCRVNPCKNYENYLETDNESLCTKS